VSGMLFDHPCVYTRQFAREFQKVLTATTFVKITRVSEIPKSLGIYDTRNHIIRSSTEEPKPNFALTKFVLTKKSIN
jgi:hypothetical protein